jgi:hypothetical protein
VPHSYGLPRSSTRHFNWTWDSLSALLPRRFTNQSTSRLGLASVIVSRISKRQPLSSGTSSHTPSTREKPGASDKAVDAVLLELYDFRFERQSERWWRYGHDPSDPDSRMAYDNTDRRHSSIGYVPLLTYIEWVRASSAKGSSSGV